MNILIVEDMNELAEVMIATLETEGHVVRHVTQGLLAIQIVQEFIPELIFMDIGLPDMTGWKCIERLRDLESTAETPIIIISAYGDPANRLVSKLQGITSYLIKPFTPEDLLQQMRDAFA